MEPVRIIRRHEVESRTGLARSTIYHLMKSNQFPAPVRMGRGAVGWVEAEINKYIDCRIANRDRGEG